MPIVKMPLKLTSGDTDAAVPSNVLLKASTIITNISKDRTLMMEKCHFWILFYFLRTEMEWLWVHLERFIEISFLTCKADVLITTPRF